MKLVGITSLASHYHRASLRVQDAQVNDATAASVVVELHFGDAIYRPTDPSAETHPLRPDGEDYTSILALDCAYHFNTRHDFLSQSFARLLPGGRIALADICFSDHTPPSPVLRRILGVLGVMPEANVVTRQEYIQTMEKIGYVDITLVDVSEHVFPGFTNFLSKQGLLWNAFVGAFGMLVKQGARFVIVTGQRTGLVADAPPSSL
jgi:hypothetical protein